MRETHSKLCNRILEQLQDFVTTDNHPLLPSDADQKEVFLNNYCSPLQVLFVNMGSSVIDDNLLDNVIRFVIHMFSREERVLNGGLFIINGLCSAVESRITQYWQMVEQFVLHACGRQATDDLGVRMALGLISDFANNMQGAIAPSLPRIVPVLQNALSDSNYKIDEKVRAIIALGDLNLACEEQFMQYFENVFDSLFKAAQYSLKNPDNEEEK